MGDTPPLGPRVHDSIYQLMRDGGVVSKTEQSGPPLEPRRGPPILVVLFISAFVLGGLVFGHNWDRTFKRAKEVAAAYDGAREVFATAPPRSDYYELACKHYPEVPVRREELPEVCYDCDFFLMVQEHCLK